VLVRVRAARANRGATGNTRMTLAATRGRGRGEKRGGYRRRPVLPANSRAERLGLIERCSIVLALEFCWRAKDKLASVSGERTP
jgi:hypothetical protein